MVVGLVLFLALTGSAEAKCHRHHMTPERGDNWVGQLGFTGGVVPSTEIHKGKTVISYAKSIARGFPENPHIYETPYMGHKWELTSLQIPLLETIVTGLEGENEFFAWFQVYRGAQLVYQEELNLVNNVFGVQNLSTNLTSAIELHHGQTIEFKLQIFLTGGICSVFSEMSGGTFSYSSQRLR